MGKGIANDRGSALDKIIAYKHGEVAELKRRLTLDELKARVADAPPACGFTAALRAANAEGRNGLICELKRKSPSAGDILPGADPVEIASQYERAGAACLSVLTDGPSFGGSEADFSAIRSAVHLPMLRKDFMIDAAQIYQSRAMGADAVLIIMAALSDAQALELCELAHDLRMDALIETHNERELQRALKLPSPLIGINNRDLTRMVTDLAVTERLAAAVPERCVLVAESGIRTPQHIARLRTVGAKCFLIGESLMKRSDREAYLREHLSTAR